MIINDFKWYSVSSHIWTYEHVTNFTIAYCFKTSVISFGMFSIRWSMTPVLIDVLYAVIPSFIVFATVCPIKSRCSSPVEGLGIAIGQNCGLHGNGCALMEVPPKCICRNLCTPHRHSSQSQLFHGLPCTLHTTPFNLTKLSECDVKSHASALRNVNVALQIKALSLMLTCDKHSSLPCP